MKVLVIGFTKISYMPYMHFYIEQLKANKCEIHLLSWKRDNTADLPAPSEVINHVFECYQEDTVPLKNKLGSFFKYRRYAKKLLKKNSFDMIVVLHSTPGVLLSDVLLTKYNRKFILDYRDFTYENISIYRSLIHQLVRCSVSTFVSSDAYRKFLPNLDNIYTSHNLLMSSIEGREEYREKTFRNNPIRIRFWGFIRHENANIQIIKKLGNDKRFELHYHGRGQKIGENLKKYCENNKIYNVYFHGEYSPEERYVFARETDLLHNIYENEGKTNFAMGNKFYDGITQYIPQICAKGSFMGEKVEQFKVGIMIDYQNDNLGDILQQYYNTLNREEFNRYCDICLEDILEEYVRGTKIINTFIESVGNFNV